MEVGKRDAAIFVHPSASVPILKLSHIRAGQVQTKRILGGSTCLDFLKFKGLVSGQKFPPYSVSWIVTLRWTQGNAKFLKSTSKMG